MIGMMKYLREDVVKKKEIMDMIVKCENKIKKRIKIGIK
jgi:hypothetical protein